MESYNAQIAGNTAAELVFVSWDHDPKEAEAWAKEAAMPWPTLLMADVPDGIKSYSPDGSVPDFVLVNSAGEVLIKGSTEEAALEAIKNAVSK